MNNKNTKSKTSTWMIYGATGYSGRLIVAEAVQRGLKPLLAGRNASALSALAKKHHNLEFRCFDLSNIEKVTNHLQNVGTLLNCAGPFSSTCKPLLQACINSQTDYLDITGEIGVFERIMSLGEKFQQAGIRVIPGVGFDVIPTDCLAAKLAQKEPQADLLELFLRFQGPISPGTLTTMLEGFYIGSVYRRNGQLTLNDHFIHKDIQLGQEKFKAVLIPWGDVSTAYHTTGIPNIKVYLLTDAKKLKLIQWANRLKSSLKNPFCQLLIKKLIQSFYKGPNTQQRDLLKFTIFGQVTGQSQQRMGLITPNGYQLTAQLAVDSYLRLLDSQLPPGSYTPVKAFGSDLLPSQWYREDISIL